MLNVLKGQLTKSMRACYNVYTIKSPPKMFNAIRARVQSKWEEFKFTLTPTRSNSTSSSKAPECESQHRVTLFCLLSARDARHDTTWPRPRWERCVSSLWSDVLRSPLTACCVQTHRRHRWLIWWSDTEIRHDDSFPTLRATRRHLPTTTADSASRLRSPPLVLLLH